MKALTYMRVIAIDLGATSGRVVAVNYKDGMIDNEIIHRFSNYLISQNNQLLWDLNKIISNVKLGIEKTLNKYNDIQSIGVDSFGCDYVDIDNIKVGLTKAYRDLSNLIFSTKLLEQINYEKIYKISGIQMLPFNTIFQLYQDRVSGKESKVLMIPDFINFELTGVLSSEITNLSTTSLIDSHNFAVSSELLNYIGLKDNPFYKVFKPAEKLGTHKYRNKEIDVIEVCTHDTASAVFSTPLDKRSCYLATGTWSLLGTLLDEPIINEASFKFNFTNEIGYKNKIRFLKNIMGMFILENVKIEFEEKEGIKINYDDLAEHLKYKKNDVYIDVDYIDFQQPGNMINKINLYLKSTNQHTLNDFYEFALCIYESLAYRYKIVFDSLKSICKTEFNKIFVIGGANQSDVLNQLIADFLHVDVYVGESEASTMGNALVQLLAKGIITEDEKDQVLKRRIKKIVKPIKSEEEINNKIMKINEILRGFKNE